MIESVSDVATQVVETAAKTAEEVTPVVEATVENAAEAVSQTGAQVAEKFANGTMNPEGLRNWLLGDANRIDEVVDGEMNPDGVGVGEGGDSEKITEDGVDGEEPNHDNGESQVDEVVGEDKGDVDMAEEVEKDKQGWQEMVDGVTSVLKNYLEKREVRADQSIDEDWVRGKASGYVDEFTKKYGKPPNGEDMDQRKEYVATFIAMLFKFLELMGDVMFFGATGGKQ